MKMSCLWLSASMLLYDTMYAWTPSITNTLYYIYSSIALFGRLSYQNPHVFMNLSWNTYTACKGAHNILVFLGAARLRGHLLGWVNALFTMDLIRKMARPSHAIHHEECFTSLVYNSSFLHNQYPWFIILVFFIICTLHLHSCFYSFSTISIFPRTINIWCWKHPFSLFYTFYTEGKIFLKYTFKTNHV
jgi:hypothetical protein